MKFQEKIKKIIYFVVSEFNKRDYDRFGVGFIKDHDFTVEVWDLTPIVNSIRWNNYTPPDPYFFDGYKIIKTLRKFKNEMCSLKGDELIICNIGYYSNTHFVYYQISKHNIRYCFTQNLNTLPFKNMSGNKGNLLDYITKIIKILFKPSKGIKYAKYFVNKLKVRWQRIKSPTFRLVSGRISFEIKNYPIAENTIDIFCHTMDYDLYLKTEREDINLSQISSTKYAVFLDEYVPFHPDTINEPDCEADSYYPSLCNLFDYIENIMKIDIIIAAHPRADYSDRPDYFEGRRIIIGKTIDLVKNSQFIICHASTAINYAILCHKPIIFVMQNEYRERYILNIKQMASTLGKSPINLSFKYPRIIADSIKMHYDLYEQYKYNYIKFRNFNRKSIWEIFVDCVNNYNASL